MVEAPLCLPITLSLLLLEVTDVFREFCILLATGVRDLWRASATFVVEAAGVLDVPRGVVTVDPLPAVAVPVLPAVPVVVVLPAPALAPVVLVVLTFFSSS